MQITCSPGENCKDAAEECCVLGLQASQDESAVTVSDLRVQLATALDTLEASQAELEAVCAIPHASIQCNLAPAM